MKVLSTARMRELDLQTIESCGIPGEILMERAGQGVASVALDTIDLAGLRGCPVHVVAGRGNNGGDAFVAARVLHEEGIPVEVWLTAAKSAVSGDALTHLGRMSAGGVTLHELPTLEDWEALPSYVRPSEGVVIDGVLGTGIKGEARGPAAGAIRFINTVGQRAYVVAIDIPSGLDSDTGQAAGETVLADVSVTMGYPKGGLVAEAAREYVGSVEVIDIGIPDSLARDDESPLELITFRDLEHGILGRRKRCSHKGTYGHLLIVGGARGFPGAPALAAMGALRSGAGLVTVITPTSVATSVASCVPEAMVQAAPETETGSLSEECLDRWAWKVNSFDAVVIGPGMTTHEQSRRVVEKVLGSARVPVVVDADALNVSAGRVNVIRGSACEVVMTPHPGELARVLACRTDEIQASREEMALKAARGTTATVVLKGAGTLVAHKDHPLQLNLTGNPGMATAGSGDVLSGVIGALLCQGVSPFDAARMGTYVHGRAGDVAALRGGQLGTIAGDIVAELPGSLRSLCSR